MGFSFIPKCLKFSKQTFTKTALFLLLIFASFSFADWQYQIAYGAFFVAIIIIAAMFAIGHGFGITEMELIAKDELYQLIVLILLTATLFGTNGVLNVFSSSINNGTYSNLQNLSLGIISEARSDLFNDMKEVSKNDLCISQNAGKSVNCNVLSAGYGMTTCGGYSMISPALSMGGSIVAFGLASISSLETLVLFASKYAMNLIFPRSLISLTQPWTFTLPSLSISIPSYHLSSIPYQRNSQGPLLHLPQA